MRVGPAGRNDLVTHSTGQGYVDQLVTVYVPDLTTTEPVFTAPESMGVALDAFPRQELPLQDVVGPLALHSPSPWLDDPGLTQERFDNMDGDSRTHFGSRHHGVQPHQSARRIDDRATRMPRPQVHPNDQPLLSAVVELGKIHPTSDNGSAGSRALDSPRMTERVDPLPRSQATRIAALHGPQRLEVNMQGRQVVCAVDGHRFRRSFPPVGQPDVKTVPSGDVGVRHQRPSVVPNDGCSRPTAAVPHGDQALQGAFDYGGRVLSEPIQPGCHLTPLFPAPRCGPGRWSIGLRAGPWLRPSFPRGRRSRR